MPTLVRLAGLRYLRRHPWQLVLAVGGVGVGVAVAVSVALATASARRAFMLSSETLTGAATHQIVAGSVGLPDDLYRQLRVDLGLRNAAPVVEGFVALADDPGRTFRLLGIDPLAEAGLRDQLGARPAQSAGLPLTDLLVQPGAVVAAASAPAEGEITVIAGGRVVHLNVLGSLESEAAGFGDVLVADLSTAQEALGLLGVLSRIDLAVGDEEQADLLPRIEALLPPQARLVRAGSRAETTVQMTEAFELNLRAMSLLAMLCGLFLIYNTITFSVVQRRQQFGVLRALGVTRPEILRLVLGESAAIGAVGTVLGLLAGVGLGSGLVHLVTRTVNDLYFVVSVRRLELSWGTLAAGVALGLGGTLLATLVPAREATRSSARLALTRSSLEEQTMRLSGRFAAAGAVLLALGLATALWPAGGLPGAFAGLFVILMAAALLAPLAVRLAAAPAGKVLRRLAGVPGLVAARGLTAGLSRTAVAVAALAIAVAVIVGVGVMVSSFRTTLIGWLDHTLAADLYASPVTAPGGTPSLPVSVDGLEALRRLEGVRRIRTIRTVELPTTGAPTQLLVVEHEEPDRLAYRLAAGDPDTAWERFATGAVLVSEPYAERRGVRVGDRLELPTPAGARGYDVAGVFYSYASDRGAVMMARSTYDRSWSDDGVSGLSFYLEAGSRSDEVAARVRAALQPALVTVVSNRELREQSLRVFDRTFLITGVLRLLVTLVAVAGVVGAVLALQLERQREHGMLRANGFTPAQLWRSVVWQSALMGTVAGAIALPLGWLLAWLMIHVINRRSFGWTLQMTVPPDVLLQAFGVAVVAATLAGALPALRIARTPPAAVLREE